MGNKDGNPQAVDLTPPSQMGKRAGSWASTTTARSSAQPWKSKDGSAEAPPRVPSYSTVAVDTERYHGTVKSFLAEKGFGFVDCPVLKEVYGRDTWVHSAQLGSFQAGD